MVPVRSLIENTLDEALRTRYISSVGNDAVFMSLFKIPEGDVTFNRANEVFIEVEEASKVVKATLQGTPDNFETKQKVKTARKKPEKKTRKGF